LRSLSINNLFTSVSDADASAQHVAAAAPRDIRRARKQRRGVDPDERRRG